MDVSRRIMGWFFQVHQNCLNRGSNTGPLDLQSNALPTELLRQYMLHQIDKQLTQVLFRLRISHKNG